MTIISERHAVEVIERSHDFTYRDDPYAGFTFDVDGEGRAIINNKDAERNYEWCLAHPELVEDEGIVVRKRYYIEPAHGRCSCGEEVELNEQYRGACQCPGCGRWYNIFGQSLIDPEYWEDDEEDY
ncbi:MAG: hypothetical protein K5637_01770 [Lachnospiraceae bacterium]|nr:hypothetical protein [Lachnospiraceae bacterium]